MELQERVEAALAKVRPYLQNDGGDVRLVEVTEDGVVRVQLMGACGGCPMANMTLKNGIERVIREQIPEITAVESV